MGKGTTLVEHTPKFVEIQPFEYQIYENENPRLITYWGFTISKNLTKGNLKSIIDDLNKKKPIDVIENPNELLEWQYEGKPLVILSKTENKIYTTQGTINHFGIRACQIQAANFLQILRKYGFAEFKQYVVCLDLKRLGRTPEERELTYEALERLETKFRNRFPKEATANTTKETTVNDTKDNNTTYSESNKKGRPRKSVYPFLLKEGEKELKKFNKDDRKAIMEGFVDE
jgi:hypothetical protein